MGASMAALTLDPNRIWKGLSELDARLAATQVSSSRLARRERGCQRGGVHAGKHSPHAPIPGAQFRTTRWSLVLRAGAEQLSPEEERRAIEELCRTYWYPLYSFIRRKGHNAESAEDLTQGFFEQLLERKSFAVANQDRGRFRTFLLSALSNFLTSSWEQARCQKRGGGSQLLSLDAVLADERFTLEPATSDTPERAFDRRWVEALLAKVLERLRADAEATGDGARFDRLKGYLVEDKGAGTFADVGRELGMTEAAIKGVVRRLRARFRELLREEVAHTVGRPDEVESELRHLLGAM